MSKQDIIKELKNYFSIVELVGQKEYERDKELCWRYFSTELLHTLLIVRRDIINAPITVNNWNKGGVFDERGLRCNVSSICKSKTSSNKLYMSPHALGMGVDFDVSGMTSEEARRLISSKEHLLPYPIRLERSVNWVHLDVFDPIVNNKKINYF